MNMGWECPKCSAVMSPHTHTCINCKPITDIKKPQCIHEWDMTMVYTSNPPKFKCKKCGNFTPAIAGVLSEISL